MLLRRFACNIEYYEYLGSRHALDKYLVDLRVNATRTEAQSNGREISVRDRLDDACRRSLLSREKRVPSKMRIRNFREEIPEWRRPSDGPSVEVAR